MAQTRVTVRWHEKAFSHEVPAMVDLGVEKAADRTADRAKLVLRGAGRIDTGALVQSIRAERVRLGLWRVGSPLPYAIYQHEGVRGPVYPRRAKVLRFKPKGSNSFVFARHTSGFKGVPFLTDALKQLTPDDYTLRLGGAA